MRREAYTGKIRFDKALCLHLASYLFWGIATTVVNLAVYFVLRTYAQFSVITSTIVAWGISVFFAFVTNRRFVFNSTNTSLGKEILLFYVSRFMTGVLDVSLMALFVTHLHFPDFPCKLVSNVIVIILNYILSKMVVFRKRKEETV